MKNFSNLTRSIRNAARLIPPTAFMLCLLGLIVPNPVSAAVADTDADGFADWLELSRGTDPGDVQSIPGCGPVVAGGENHSLAILPDGRVLAWGSDADGKLGDGDPGENRPCMDFVLAPDGQSPLSGAAAIGIGEVHSAALMEDGTVLCWGANGYGQLGNNQTGSASLPVNVIDDITGTFLTGVLTMETGGYHTLVLATEGKVKAWGRNGSGQLGDNTTSLSRTAIPVLNTDGTDTLTGVVSLAAGHNHSLLLMADGTVLAFGANGYGQLGDGSTANAKLPQPVLSPDGTGLLDNVVAVAAGNYFSLAIKADGTLWSWGQGSYGRLGCGSTSNEKLPVQVLGIDGTGLLQGVSAISPGLAHNLAIIGNGDCVSFGKNGAGQLGIDSTAAQNAPVAVFSPDATGFLTDIVAVGAGQNHSFALQTGFRLYAFGGGDRGKLGTGDTSNRKAPTLVDSDADLLSDYWEMAWFGTLDTDPAADPDQDGISNYDEYLALTDPTQAAMDPDADDDGDGMTNGWEDQFGLDWQTDDAAGDLDGDGLANLAEFQAGTDPSREDTDFDGIPDLYELEMGFNPALPTFERFLGLWKFDEAAGTTAFDVSALGNHAQLSGPVRTIDADGASVLLFDGIDDRVNLPAEPARASDTFTLTVRLKVGAPYGNAVAAPATDGEMTLLDLPGDTAAETIRFYKTSAHALAVAIGGQTVVDTPDVTILPGAWYQATAVVDPVAGTTRLHVNGLQVDSGGAVAPLGAGAATFGSDAAGSTPFNGAVDLVCFLNQAMTVEDVALLDEPFADPDGDGLANVYEYGNQSSPFNPDTDGDSISDLDELKNGTDPANPDTDGDYLNDADEYAAGTDPLIPDTDMDGLLDGWEVANAMDPLDGPGSLLAWWSFDETEGQTATDHGPGGFDAALAGTESQPAPLAFARAFDGVGDSAQTAAAPAFAGDEFSVVARVRFDKLYGNTVTGSAEDGAMTVTALRDAAGEPLLTLSLTPRHAVSAKLRDPDTGTTVTLESPHAFALPDQWYVIALSFGRPTLTLVVDGVPAAAATCDHPMNWTPETVLFATAGSADDGRLAGALDDQRLYGKALDGDDLAVLSATADDVDGDGCSAYVESIHGTNPDSLDSDRDGLSDAVEIAGTHGTDPANYDSDDDGMADGWELNYGFDPLDDSNMLLDPDGDELTNIEEYLFGANPLMADTDNDTLSDFDEVYTYGTDPAKADTDGDGQPDAWELAEGTDPFTPDGTADQDGDGLANETEYALGTDPAVADTDGDGVSDYEEIKLARSSPLVADFDGTSTLIADIPGSAYTDAAGNWTRSGTSALADTRGSVDFTFDGSQAGMFRVAVTGEHVTRTVSCSDARPIDRSNLLLYVDGLYLGRHVLIAPDGVPGTLVFYTPRLAVGDHTLRVEWENVHRKTTFRIHSVEVTMPGGTDVDGNGVSDWQTNSLSTVTSLEIGPDNEISGAGGSYISPVCLEGRTRFVELLAVQAAGQDIPVNPGAGERWYADVELDLSAPVAVAADFQNGARTIQSQISWIPFVVSENESLTLRAGDALRLDGRPSGSIGGTADIAINGVTFYPGVTAPVAHTFINSGKHVISTVFHATDGTTTTASATVTVIGGSFPADRLVLLAGRPRQWNCPELPEKAVVEGDAHTTVVPEGFLRTVTAREVEGRSTLVARTGENGPILDSANLDTFLLQAAVDGYLWHVETYDDGTELWRQEVFERHLPDDVEVRIHIFVAGATLDDLTMDRTIIHADFNDIGQYDFGLLSPTSLNHSTCHFIRAYHNGQPVGEAYYNRYLLPAQ